LNLLIKPFWIFGIDRKVQNIVGANEYGLYFSLFGFSLIIYILLDLGITNYNNRNIAMHHHMLPKYLSKILVIKLLLGIFYAIVALTLGVILGYSARQFHVLYFLIFNQFLLSLVLYFRSNISGLHLFKTDSVLSVVDRTLMIVFCSILIWGNLFPGQFRIEWFVYAQTLSYSITAIISFLVVLKKSAYFKPSLNFVYLKLILRQSFPFALLVLLMSFYNRVDSVMLERLLPDGKTQAGIYAQGFRILDAFSNFSVLFAGLLLPIFSRMIKQKEEVGEIVNIAYKLLIGPALFIVAISLVHDTTIIDIMYQEHIIESSKVFALLMIGLFFISTSYIYGTLLTANGNLTELNILAGSAVFINVGLNFILIPIYQALGSAIASMITQLLMATGQIFLATRRVKYRQQWNTFFLLGIYFALLIGIAFLLNKTGLHWGFQWPILGFMAVGLMLSLKLFSIKEAREIFGSKD
jgi:O-antigen/teichoic acid export membrane protein